MNGNLEWGNSTPSWLIGVAAFVLVVFWTRTYWKEFRHQSFHFWLLLAVSMRVTLIAVLIFLCWQPTSIHEERSSNPFKNVIALDTSSSMNQRDEPGPNYRLWSAPYTDSPNKSINSDILSCSEHLGVAKLMTALADRAAEIDESKRLMRAALKRLQATLTILQDLESEPNLESLDFQELEDAVEGVEKLVQKWLKATEPQVDVGEEEPISLVELTNELVEMNRSTAVFFQQIVNMLDARDSDSSTATVAKDHPINFSKTAPFNRMQLVEQWLNDPKTQEGLTTSSSEVSYASFADSKTWTTFSQLPELQNEDNHNKVHLTDLQSAIDELGRMADEDCADLAVIITDGVDTRSVNEFRLPDSLSFRPIIVVPIGDPNQSGNVTIRSVNGPRFGRKGDLVPINVTIESKGLVKKQAVVELTDGQIVVQTREVDFLPGPITRSVDFTQALTNDSIHEYVVRVRPRDKDALWVPVEQQHHCRITRDKLNVLLVDSTPRWETRYLNSLFRRDSEVSLQFILFSSGDQGFPGRKRSPSIALPLSERALQRFDIIILGDLTPAQLSHPHQEALAEYVRAGGNLIVIAGHEFMPVGFADQPLAEILPVKPAGNFVSAKCVVQPESSFAMRPFLQLKDGDVHSNSWLQAYKQTPLQELSSWNQPKEAAETLLIATDSNAIPTPLLTIHRLGSGSVAFLGAPVTFHLRVLVGDELHHRFWGQLLRAISDGTWAQERMISITPVSDTIDSPGTVRSLISLRDRLGRPITDANLQVTVYQRNMLVGSGLATRIENQPGVYSSEILLQQTGEYELRLEGDKVDEVLAGMDPAIAGRQRRSCTVRVGTTSMPAETEPLNEVPSFFRQLNDLPMAITVAPGRVPELIQELKLRKPIQVHLERHPLWNRWWILLCICTIMTCEWTIRRIFGLG